MNTQHRRGRGDRLNRVRERARYRRALMRGRREAHRRGLTVEHVVIQDAGGPRWLNALWIGPDGDVVSLRLFGGAHIVPCDGSEETPW